jgi:putative endonuclease
MRDYYVYIMSDIHRTLYVGVTNDLFRRVYEHRSGVIPGFTKRYGLRMLVWHEQTGDVLEALAREKQIKAWREKKVALIRSVNPEWKDLSGEWF